MKVIRFEVEGFINSYAIPFYRTYQKSFLAPPKTTIIGMLCNISLKPQKEFFDILEKDLIQISVVINKIEGKIKDLWTYKNFKNKNRGKGIIRRDKLFMPNYTVYLNIKDEELYDEILSNLKYPKNIPSLGLDDEMIFIKNIEEINLEKTDSNKVDSVFMQKEFLKYEIYIKNQDKDVELPISNKIPLKFKAFNEKGKRIPKEPLEDSRFYQTEFLNCQIKFNDYIDSFKDSDMKTNLVFY